MARIRYIKPDFFKDEDLACLDPLTRLFFAGLWCWADKKGRLECRPRFLKAEIFPYDDFNPDKGLELLEVPKIKDRPEKRFITTYTVKKVKYIQIEGFTKHQKPHRTEKESEYPSPNDAITVKEPLDTRYKTPDNGDGQRTTETDNGERTTVKGEGEKTRRKMATKNSSQGFVLLKDRFLKVVSDRKMEYYFAAKDGGALKHIQEKLIHLCREKNPTGELTDEKVADAFEYLLTHVKMKFVLENFTIPIINSKWNEIVNEVKGVKNGATREQKIKQDLADGYRKIDELYGATKPN